MNAAGARELRELRRQKLERLKQEIAKGDADIAAGRFDRFETDMEIREFFERL